MNKRALLCALFSVALGSDDFVWPMWAGIGATILNLLSLGFATAGNALSIVLGKPAVRHRPL